VTQLPRGIRIEASHEPSSSRMADSAVARVVMTPTQRDELFVQLSRDIDVLMRERKVSQRALASLSGVTQQTILNILKGRPSTTTSLFRVLGALRAEFKVCPKRSGQLN
jgi:DNA-binding XRE family transcriptional regulator